MGSRYSLFIVRLNPEDLILLLQKQENTYFLFVQLVFIQFCYIETTYFMNI